MRVYFLAVLVSNLALFVCQYYTIEGSIFKAFSFDYSDYNITDYVRANRLKWKVFLLIPLTLILTFGSYSCFYAYKSLNEPGIGHEVRKKVI